MLKVVERQNQPFRRCATLVLAVMLLTAGGGGALAATPDPAGVEFFEKKIRPVLVEHCYECHSAKLKAPKGDLLLDSREGMRKGGNSGPVIVPGKPDASLLMKVIRSTDKSLRMPQNGKLQ